MVPEAGAAKYRTLMGLGVSDPRGCLRDGEMRAKDEVWRIFNSLSFPVLLIDRDYRVSEMNSAAACHLGRSREEIRGRSCYELTHGLGEPCWRPGKVVCPVNQAFESGKRAQAIHRHEIDGQIIVEEIVATPLDEGDGEINHVIEELRDVTELLDLRDGILPICSSCKRIREPGGSWRHIETYIRERTGADFSHSFCPECCVRLYPSFSEAKDEE